MNNYGSKNQLTTPQRLVYGAIINIHEKTGKMPTHEEIAFYLSYGGGSCVRKHIKSLQIKGLIKVNYKKHRGIEFVKGIEE